MMSLIFCTCWYLWTQPYSMVDGKKREAVRVIVKKKYHKIMLYYKERSRITILWRLWNIVPVKKKKFITWDKSDVLKCWFYRDKIVTYTGYERLFNLLLSVYTEIQTKWGYHWNNCYYLLMNKNSHCCNNHSSSQ